MQSEEKSRDSRLVWSVWLHKKEELLWPMPPELTILCETGWCIRTDQRISRAAYIIQVNEIKMWYTIGIKTCRVRRVGVCWSAVTYKTYQMGWCELNKNIHLKDVIRRLYTQYLSMVTRLVFVDPVADASLELWPNARNRFSAPSNGWACDGIAMAGEGETNGVELAAKMLVEAMGAIVRTVGVSKSKPPIRFESSNKFSALLFTSTNRIDGVGTAQSMKLYLKDI